MMNQYSDHPDRGEGAADPNEHQSDAAKLPAEKPFLPGSTPLIAAGIIPIGDII